MTHVRCYTKYIFLPLCLVVILAIAPRAAAAQQPTKQNTGTPSCSEEFETCVVNRDCCGSGDGALSCVMGDWAVTTDSTCLSKRSEALEKLSKDKKRALIETYYTEKVPPESRKTLEEVQKILGKYSRSFLKLVHRLEKRYQIPVISDNDLSNTGDEL